MTNPNAVQTSSAQNMQLAKHVHVWDIASLKPTYPNDYHLVILGCKCGTRITVTSSTLCCEHHENRSYVSIAPTIVKEEGRD